MVDTLPRSGHSQTEAHWEPHVIQMATRYTEVRAPWRWQRPESIVHWSQGQAPGTENEMERETSCSF